MEIYVRMTEGRDRGRKKSVDRTLGLDMIEVGRAIEVPYNAPEFEELATLAAPVAELDPQRMLQQVETAVTRETPEPGIIASIGETIRQTGRRRTGR